MRDSAERQYRGEVRKAARAGLKRLTAFLEGKTKVTDDERLAAKLGLGAVSVDVRLVSADTNRMAVELMREKWGASNALPAGRDVTVESEAA